MATRMTNRSARMEQAFDRMGEAYGVVAEAEPFSAVGVYDKVAFLAVLALLSGTVGYLAAGPGLIMLGIFAGLGLSLLGVFRPATARFVAPLYALAEGLALGGITSYYAVQSHGIAPAAILFTGGIFVGALVLFRTGIVKVTPRLVSMTIIASFGFLAVLVASAFGLSFPGLGGQGGMLLIGVIGVVIGVLYLFIDFDYIQHGEGRALPAQAEWYAALTVMMSIVFIYLNVLRMLGNRR